ncbi:MAG: hypothetical protein V1822_02105, partial [Candidatus Micrarchaeota archaeon]
MKIASFALVAIILAISIAYAQGTVAQPSLGSSGLFQNGICPQCYQSSLQVDASQYPLIKVHASYMQGTFEPPTHEQDPQGQISGNQLILTPMPAPNSIVSFQVNGYEVLSSSGTSCASVITDADGNAECEVIYILAPGASAPALIDSMSTNAVLTANLLYSEDNPQIKPSSSSPILIRPKNSRGADIFSLLSAQAQSPSGIALCLPAIIVLGLLIASMQYMGKNPLSLFDITVPRLPAFKKPRMKPASIPLNLALKGRMSARIIRRAERATISSIVTLYLRSGKSWAGVTSEVRSLFPYKTAHAGPKSFDEAQYRQALARLKELIEASGASKTAQERAWGVVQRNLQVREALTQDLAVTGAARAGDKSKWAKNINTAIDYAGRNIAKPWKLIFGENRWSDRVPGIPYVERISLVAQNWVGSRYGNLMVRRALYKGVAAETARTLGIAKNSQFVQKNIYDGKKVGEIPRIVERLRQETYILGRAIVDEYMRALALSASLRHTGSHEFEIDKSGMRDVMSIMQRIRKEMDEKVKRGEISSQFRLYYENERIMQELQKYLAGRPMYDALGQKLSDAEAKEFADKAVEYAKKVREIIMQDRYATSDGRYPSFSDETLKAARFLNPEEVLARHKQVVGMLDYSREQLKNGRIPMVMLGHDMAEIFGIAVNAKISAQSISVKSEAQRLAQMRYMFEAEFSKKLLF